MSEIIEDTGERISGGRALLLCICHECGNNFKIQKRRFSRLKPCLMCVRKKQNAWKPLYAKIEELEQQLKERDELIRQAIPVIEQFKCLSEDENIRMMEWLEKAHAIQGER